MGIGEMRQKLRIAILATKSVGVGLLVGCATVNPRPDYQRAAETIERATGQVDSFRPDDDHAVAARVEQLLEGGVTADEAAAIALLNNPQLQVAFYDIGIARSDVVQSGLLANPSLGMALRLPSGGGLANFEADLAQNVADLWQIPIRKRAAQRALDRTILDVARLASETAAAGKAAYYAAVGAESRVGIARENLEVACTVLELTEFRRTAGAGSELDVNLASGVVLETELAVQEARLAAADARRTLASLLGLATNADELALVGPLPDAMTHELNAEQLLSTALRQRLDLRAVLEATHSAAQRLKLEYRRVFPSLEIGLALERGERGRSKDRDLFADTARASVASGRLTAPEIEPRSAREKHTDLIIGPSLALDLPIFDQNQAQIARARFELQQALRLLDGLERSISQEVRGAADQAQTAWRIARFYRDEVVPQARKSLEMSRESYHAGKSSILSVLDAERTYLSAREGYAAALEESASALPRLERVVGVPVHQIIRAGAGDGGPTTTQPAAGQPGARSDGQ
jgi:cobalt-zinc-cadmium efflux system outer membrane protein